MVTTASSINRLSPLAPDAVLLSMDGGSGAEQFKVRKCESILDRNRCGHAFLLLGPSTPACSARIDDGPNSSPAISISIASERGHSTLVKASDGISVFRCRPGESVY